MSESQSTKGILKKLEYEWLQELSDDNLKLMVKLLNEVAETSGTNGYSDRLTPEQEQGLASKIRASLSSGDAHILFVRHRETGEVIGSVTLEAASQPARKHIVEVRRSVITQKYRGKIFRFATAEIFKKCKQLKFETIQIDVSEDGPIKLLEHYGFRIFGRVSDYARVGSRKLEGFYMSLNLGT